MRNRFKYSLIIIYPLLIQSSYCQLFSSNVLQIGYGLASDLSAQTGTITRDITFRISYRLSSNVYRFEVSEVRVGYEFGYNHLKGYRFNVDHLIINEFKRRQTYDEYHELTFADVGIFPEYNYVLANGIILGARFGFSLGIGTEYLSVNKLSDIVLDTTKYSIIDNNPMYGVYGEYNIAPLRLPRTYQIGMNIIIDPVNIDCRIIRGDSGYPGSFHKSYYNILLMFGLLF